jgi:hypothetical protein
MKPCEKDNKTVFDKTTDYSIYCEFCKMHVKVYRFRSCEFRIQSELARGNDILRPIIESNKIAQVQTGQKIEAVGGYQPVGGVAPPPSPKGTVVKPANRRGGR